MHFLDAAATNTGVVVRLDEGALLQVVVDDVDGEAAVRVADVLVDVAAHCRSESAVSALKRLHSLQKIVL